MPNPPHRHCSHCGTAYRDTRGYPRTCPNPACGAVTWANPVPVAVILVPVEHEGRLGLLVIRRGIEPRAGHLALPGGFVDLGETWQAAGAREVREETGVVLDADALEPFSFTSTAPTPNRILLFATSRPIPSGALPRLPNTREVTERGLIFGPGGLDEVFAFPLHHEAVRRWFSERGNEGPHAFSAC